MSRPGYSNGRAITRVAAYEDLMEKIKGNHAKYSEKDIKSALDEALDDIEGLWVGKDEHELDDCWMTFYNNGDSHEIAEGALLILEEQRTKDHLKRHRVGKGE